MKLLISDLDGTLFDTGRVNYEAYREAMAGYGYSLDYGYYCRYCNGRHYQDFLPEITASDEDLLSEIHEKKKLLYPKYLGHARPNQGLIDILLFLKPRVKLALVTTASFQNTHDILGKFDMEHLFDLVITREDVQFPKPNPEGFLKCMEHFHTSGEDTVIFEDSEPGIEAARRCGAVCFAAKGYNGFL